MLLATPHSKQLLKQGFVLFVETLFRAVRKAI